jgi:superfamily II DNA or RNA helicase
LNSLYKGPPLRAWQAEAIEAWDKHRIGIIQAVPGAGKTILAVKLFTQKLEEENNLKVLIVCPRLTLIQQWVDAISEFSNIKKNEIYEVSSNNESKAYVCAQGKLANYKVFISTFHQIKQFFNECKWKDHNWLLIVDEMHNTTENYKFPNAPIKYKLGLSATPKKKGRDADFNLGGIVYTYSFSQALQDKIILDPVIKIVFYSVNKQLFKKIQSNSDETSDLVESAYDDFLPDAGADELEKILFHQDKSQIKPKQALNEEQEIAAGEQEIQNEEADVFTSKSTDFVGIQRILEDQFHIGQKESVQTLVFVNRIKKADLLNKMLAEKFSEKVSHSYHSKSDKYNQKNHFNQLKQQFSEGKFNVLISVGTLGEGIDFPYASHGIIASPIYNPTSFVQKVGRLLRSYKDHKKAVIYYYVPSELITRLLTDEKIEPNYFKSIIKIADDNKDLYFVDRKSLSEEQGSLSELLIQGSAYERNEDVKRLKIPHDLDSIMRFFKRVYPDNLKEWKKLYTDQVDAEKAKRAKKKKIKPGQEETIEEEDATPIEIDFEPLRKELSKNYAIMLTCAENMKHNLQSISLIQKKYSTHKFKDFVNVKGFVKEALKQKIITKIKYGHELEKIATDEKSVLSPSEQEMLTNMVAAEVSDFCSKQKDLEKCLTSLNSSIKLLNETAKLKNDDSKVIATRITGMNRIAKTHFDLQSLFLDELEMNELSKCVASNEKKFFLTIGKDIFLTKQIVRKFSYPEDFGLSRWREEKEAPIVVITLTPVEKFAKRLMHLMVEEEKEKGHYVGILVNWQGLKERVSKELEITPPTDMEILKELEKHKCENEFSFEKLFFVTEAIKRKK